MSGITRLLQNIEHGEPKAADELHPLVYAELRHLAAHNMAREAPGQTLQPTALVHEAWLRLTGMKMANGVALLISSRQQPKSCAASS